MDYITKRLRARCVSETLPEIRELLDEAATVIDARDLSLHSAAYARGLTDAADYVDGNWSDAHTMANHLREVASGNRPMHEP